LNASGISEIWGFIREANLGSCCKDNEFLGIMSQDECESIEENNWNPEGMCSDLQ